LIGRADQQVPRDQRDIADADEAHPHRFASLAAWMIWLLVTCTLCPLDTSTPEVAG
jgi:hypothetical protein